MATNEQIKEMNQLEDDLFQAVQNTYWILKEMSSYSSKNQKDFNKYIHFLNSIGIGPETFDEDYEEE